MSVAYIEAFLRGTGRTHVLQGPPSMQGMGCPTPCGSTGLYQPAPKFELGEVVHIPQLWSQGYSSWAEGNSGSGLTSDNRWNSWVGDPTDPLFEDNVPPPNKITKHTPPPPGSVGTAMYRIEYWFAAKDQGPLTVDDPRGLYKVGDAGNEPQNIFDTVTLPAGTDPPFNTKGYRVGAPIPSTSFSYQFKGYMMRVTMILKDESVKEIYQIVFVPLDTTIRGFTKVITRDESKPLKMLDLDSAVSYEAQFNYGSRDLSVPAAAWDQTDTSTDAIHIRIDSEYLDFSGDTQQRDNTVKKGLIGHTGYALMDPAKWDATAKPWYSIIITSPQAQLSAWVNHVSLNKLTLVYRAIVRGWVVRGIDGQPSRLSDVFVYQFEPSTSGSGVYTSVRLLGISSTHSSTAGVFGITYQPVNVLKFYRQCITREGYELPASVASNTPQFINMNSDLTSDLVGNVVPPSHNNHIRIKPTYDETSPKSVYGTLLNELILKGSYRLSEDEGQSYTTWASVGTTNPYIDPASYLGTGTPDPKPGFQVSVSEVTQGTLLQPGEYKTQTAVDDRKLAGDFLEISISLT